MTPVSIARARKRTENRNIQGTPKFDSPIRLSGEAVIVWHAGLTAQVSGADLPVPAHEAGNRDREIELPENRLQIGGLRANGSTATMSP
jgi:hypothetical protein